MIQTMAGWLAPTQQAGCTTWKAVAWACIYYVSEHVGGIESASETIQI